MTFDDVTQALRPGGPMDTTFVVTRCLACGKNVSRSLRWYHEKPHICPDCGGALDVKPLQQATLASLKDYKASLERHYRLRDPAG
jgi:hypothetical protein